MSKIKLMMSVACLSMLGAGTAWAQPGWPHHHHRHFYGPYGYGPPIYAYPPVVAVPPPVVVTPQPAYVAPGPGYMGPGFAYGAPGPVYAAPGPAYVTPPPVYPAPAYGYGMVGPRGYGFGYAQPGFGAYFGR